MPDGIVPDEDGATALRYWLKQTISGVLPWKLMLWEGATVPDFDTVLADLTECTWSGYTRVSLDRNTWTDPVVTDGCAETTYGTTALIWYVSSTNTTPVAGWAIVDDLAGVLRYVQRFDLADQLTPTAGQQYQLLPKITQTNAPC